MKDQLSTLETALRQHGYSITAARRAVFKSLLDKEPQTMAELSEATGGLVNRASLYRIIALFESIGVVERLNIGWKYKIELSDSFASHHHHITCLLCGRVRSFNESLTLSSELKQIASQNGYTASGHQLELRGICSKCQLLK